MAKVTIYTQNPESKEHGVLEFEGDVDIGMNGGNALVISEKVPNLTGNGEPLSRIKCLVNSSAWTHAEVG